MASELRAVVNVFTDFDRAVATTRCWPKIPNAYVVDRSIGVNLSERIEGEHDGLVGIKPGKNGEPEPLRRTSCTKLDLEPLRPGELFHACQLARGCVGAHVPIGSSGAR
jgi:hypothetical protein